LVQLEEDAPHLSEIELESLSADQHPVLVLLLLQEFIAEQPPAHFIALTPSVGSFYIQLRLILQPENIVLVILQDTFQHVDESQVAFYPSHVLLEHIENGSHESQLPYRIFFAR